MANHDTQQINAVAWLCWFAAAAAIPLVSRNPFYLLLGFSAVIVVYSLLPRKTGAARAWRFFAVTGSTIAVLSIGFNLLTVHVGDQVITHLPAWIPIAGGNLTYNALIYGVTSALAISTLLFAAAVFNTAVRHADLIRLLPASLSRFGIAGSIALSFVPATISVAHDIYDAQRARGHRLRNIRDAHGFITPLFSTGLERAMVLSEALETRGFGTSTTRAGSARHKLVAYSLAGLCLLLALVFLAYGHLLAGLLSILIAVVVPLTIQGRQVTRSSFRKTSWNVSSTVVVAGALLPILLVGLHLIVDFPISYEPFPVLDVPPFNPLAGLAFVGLLAPAIWNS